MSSRNLDITADQAAVLLPLLQAIVPNQPTIYPGISETAFANTDSSPEASAVEDNLLFGQENMLYKDNENPYRLQELIRKKKKNSKSTVAQNFLHVWLSSLLS